MPDVVREALEAEGLTNRYNERPRPQRHVTLGWIANADPKAGATQRKAARCSMPKPDTWGQGTIFLHNGYRRMRRSL